MGELLATSLFLVLALQALARGAQAIQELQAEAGQFAAAWQAEYTLRRCGTLAAAARNLRASAETIEESLAVHDPALQRRAAVAAAELAQELRAAYPAGPLPDAAGDCQIAGTGGLDAYSFLHEEKHAGQPPAWPNWVVRYVIAPLAPVAS